MTDLDDAEDPVTDLAEASGRLRMAALFPGQGSQFMGVGRALAQRSPVAGELFDLASQTIGIDVADLCWHSDESTLAETQNAQLAVVLVGVAAWCSWAQEHPADRAGAVFAGHSVGMLAAAIAAGCLPVAEGLLLARARGEIMASAPGRGAMLAVAAGPGEARERVEQLAHELALDVAAVNGRRQVVLSGAPDAIEAARTRLRARAVPLAVSHAFHSRHMLPVVERWHAAVADVSFAPPTGPLVSGVTGALLTTGDDVAQDLRDGLVATVRWDLVMARIRPVERWVGFGPATMLSRIAREEQHAVTCIGAERPGALP